MSMCIGYTNVCLCVDDRTRADKMHIHCQAGLIILYQALRTSARFNLTSRNIIVTAYRDEDHDRFN